MPDQYAAVLHYLTGDVDVATTLAPMPVTRSDGGTERTVPALLGADAFGRPYEVVDVEVNAELIGAEWRVLNTVHLRPAETDTLRGHRSAAYHRGDDAQAREHLAVRNFWRPDIWAPVEAVLAGRRARRNLAEAVGHNTPQRVTSGAA